VRDLVLLLIPLAFAVAVPTTWTVRWLSRRLNAVDTAPLPGQVKAPPRPVPNTGGAAIFLAIAGPIAAMLLLVRLAPGTLTSIFPPLTPHLPGLVSESGPALAFLAGLTLLHVIGLIDDRTPLGPKFKLAVMLGVSAVVVLGTGTRLLTMLDASVGGPWLSVLVTVLWIVAVTNAMNFMDNMDGLTGGVAAIAGGCFLAAALMHDQWFVAACLSLLIGGCLGFLIFNFPAPKASIFMGDGGSLVVGFTLAFLTVRTTYYVPDPAAAASAGWYAVFMPLVVLAVGLGGHHPPAGRQEPDGRRLEPPLAPPGSAGPEQARRGAGDLRPDGHHRHRRRVAGQPGRLAGDSRVRAGDAGTAGAGAVRGPLHTGDHVRVRGRTCAWAVASSHRRAGDNPLASAADSFGPGRISSSPWT